MEGDSANSTPLLAGEEEAANITIKNRILPLLDSDALHYSEERMLSQSRVDVVPLPPQERSYDPSLTVVDGDNSDEIFVATTTTSTIEEEEEEEFPPLPPLVSYCSYVKFFCCFSKWLLPVVITNISALLIPLFLGYDEPRPSGSWLGLLSPTVWICTSMWLYLAAHVIERDVEKVDEIAQYEQGRLSEEEEGNNNAIETGGVGVASNGITSTSSDVNLNYEHIYGQVSRKIDMLLTPNDAPHMTTAQQPEGTSFLTNLCYALWALTLAAGVYRGTKFLVGDDDFMPSNISQFPEEVFKNISTFKNISQFPEEVQNWIVADKISRGDIYYRTYSDDAYTYKTDGEDISDHYTFPTAKKSDVGVVATMDDRIIFAAKAPPTENGSKSASYVVLAEVSTVNGNSSTIKYHRGIFNPRTFIPVQSTIDKDNSDRASQYCFTGTEDPDKPPSRHNAQQKTLIHCIHTDLSDNKSSTILTTTIYWKNDWHNHRIFAASYQGLVLISHSINEYYEPMYQEVQQINPTTMETSIIYHSVLSRENGDNDDYYSQPTRPPRFGEKKISKFSILVGILVLGLTSAWLIIREGVPSGVIPFVYALVGILVLLFGFRKAFSGLSLTVGTVFFHCMIFFGGGWRGCRLPVWIGRDMYTWALYGWISAFLVENIFDAAYYVIIDTLAPVYLALTGIILGHPVMQIMGYSSFFMGFIFVLSNFVYNGFLFFNFDQLIKELLIPILIGVGLIVVGNWISANRKFTAARCRHIDRYCRARYRPRQSSPP